MRSWRTVRQLGSMSRATTRGQRNPVSGLIGAQNPFWDSSTTTIKPRNLSTLILGNTDVLTEYAKQLGKTIPGKIVVVESFEPFNSSDPDRDLKYAGNTGIICCQDGQPIYRKTEYTLDQTREDVLLDHNNGDAIRAANETAFNLVKKSKVKNATTAEAFGLKQVEDEIVDEEVVDEVETEDEVLEEEAETFDL